MKKSARFYNSENRNKLLIKRIINRLTQSNATQNQLEDDCLINNKRIKEILSILIKDKRVKILEIKERGTIYELNKEVKK